MLYYFLVIELKWLINKSSYGETAMATLQIENLPDELYSQIERLAAENNFTFSEAVIHLLKQSFETDKITINQEEPKKTMSEILQRIRSRPRVNPIDFGLTDSTILIREDRHR
jgi:hypothetical protein